MQRVATEAAGARCVQRGGDRETCEWIMFQNTLGKFMARRMIRGCFLVAALASAILLLTRVFPRDNQKACDCSHGNAGQFSPLNWAVNKQDSVLLTLIFSTPLYKDRRFITRQQWIEHKTAYVDNKSQRRLLHFKFICGLVNDSSTNAMVQWERKQYGDIVIADLLDSYKGLVRKVLWAFQWAIANVRFQFLMKTDDDVFINIHKLLCNVVYPLSNKNTTKRLYYGNAMGLEGHRGNPIDRNPSGKWYVPQSAYAPDRYPPYNQGHGYILSRDMVNLTIKSHIANRRQIVEVEDAYVGILMYENHVKPVRDKHIHDWISIYSCRDKDAILIGGSKPTELQIMMANAKSGKPICDGIPGNKIAHY